MQWASGVSRLTHAAAAISEVVDQVQRQLGDGDPPDLAVLFLSSEFASAAEAVLAQLVSALPTATVLGCTAGSVIGGGQEVEEGAAVALAVASLPGVTIQPFHLAPESVPKDASTGLVSAPADEPPCFVLLGDPFTGDAEAVIQGLGRGYPGCVQVGGLASGADRPGGNRLFLGSECLTEGFAGVALTGNVVVDTVVAQGCRPIGQPMFVTRCRDNLLLEVDGRPPSEVLSELYAEADARERALFQSSLFIGMQMHADKLELGRGDFLVRNLLGADPETGSLAVSVHLQETQVVQFQLRDGITASEDLEAHLGSYAEQEPRTEASGALLFSCLGRGRAMYGVANHDSDAFRRHLGDVPIAGFFCNGEIGPVEGRVFLHGYTSAFGIFRPRDDSPLGSPI